MARADNRQAPEFPRRDEIVACEAELQAGEGAVETATKGRPTLMERV